MSGAGLAEVGRARGPSWTPPSSQWTIGTGGIGWVLYVPEGENSSARVRSDEQGAPVVYARPDATTWTWSTVSSETGVSLDISVTMTLAADGGMLRASLCIDNRSASMVDSALFPWIRGFSLPEGTALTALTRDYYGAKERPLWPTFEWNKGYYGTIRPTLMTDSLVFGNPTAPFAVMLDGREAVAAWVDGPTPEITSWMWELEPGYGDTIGDRVPRAASGVVAELRFSAVHLLDLAPGTRGDLATIVLSQAVGGWQDALRPYRAARERTYVPSATTPGWASEPHTWFQVGLNTPVGDERFAFADLPDLARECAENSVDVLHVIGWNLGGQDRNNPSHDPDPALGGPEGLRAAIAACHALGVRVVLFAKFNWADLATERFRTELTGCAIRDPYGDHYRNGGYQYLTPHQLLDVSTRRLVPMCYLHEHYLAVCEQEFDKIIASGADGMLFDETMHHTPALLCYATGHGHRPGVSAYSGDIALAARLRARVPAGREFLFAGETIYEDLQASYDLSYNRSHYTAHQPLHRYVSPHLRIMVTVAGFDDRNQVNQALLLGYSQCYEPRHFKGRLGDIPSTVAYGRRAEDLRRELAAILWHGSYLGDADLIVDSAGEFATAAWAAPSGERLWLVANYDPEAIATVRADEKDAVDLTEYRTVEADWRPIPPSGIAVPPRTLSLMR